MPYNGPAEPLSIIASYPPLEKIFWAAKVALLVKLAKRLKMPPSR